MDTLRWFGLAAVGLMLLSMAIYIMTDDESIQPRCPITDEPTTQQCPTE
jgi:hypothetical protein